MNQFTPPKPSRLLALITAVFLVATSGCSEPNVPTTESIQTPVAVDGETLLLQAPPAWLRGRESIREKFRIVEFLPAGNDQESWYEKLTVESNSISPLPDPIEFANQLGEDLKEQCKTSEHQNITTALENGYQTSVRLLVCQERKETGRNSVSLVKAILGTQYFYTITYTKRSEPLATERSPISNDEIAKWSLYMRSIKLCDSRAPEHPCPASAVN